MARLLLIDSFHINESDLEKENQNQNRMELWIKVG